MTTVNTQDNPVTPAVGSRDSDAVVITSQQPNTGNIILYQIENIATGARINIDSRMNDLKGGNLVFVDAVKLKIILESRTKYRVRTKHQFGPFGLWANFTTRDKRYQSPDAITDLTDNTDLTAKTSGKGVGTGRTARGREIVVSNGAKAEVTIHTRLDSIRKGARVVNSDTIFADGQLQPTGTVNGMAIRAPVAFTNRGATVVNLQAGKNRRIRFTNRGATIDNTAEGGDD